MFFSLVLFLIILFGHFNLDVKALELENEMDNDILVNYSNNIVFLDNNMVLIKGSIGKKLTIGDVLLLIDEDGLNSDYNVSDIYVTDDSYNLFENEDEVVNGEQLVFEINGNNGVSYVNYKIMLVGDINNDSVIDDSDITAMIDSVLNYGDSNVVNDINRDGYFDILDITGVIYAVSNNSWNNDTVNNDNLVSEISNTSINYVGEEVIIKYIIRGFDKDFINGISGVIDYDKSMLELTDVLIDSKYGYINNDGKFLYVMDDYDNEEVLITFKFKAINVGDTRVSINNIMASMNGIEVNLDTNCLTSDVVTLKYGTGGDGFDDVDNSTTDEVIGTSKKVVNFNNEIVSKNEGKVNNIIVTYASISSDNYIKDLIINGYDIDFDSDVLEYSIDVDNDITELDLDVTLNDDKATYEVIGNTGFKVGNNVVTIEVTAEDGSVRTYTINVNKNKALSSDKEDSESDDGDKSNSSRIVIIILIILVIIGLIYVIFKDDEEEESNNKEKKQI